MEAESLKNDVTSDRCKEISQPARFNGGHELLTFTVLFDGEIAVLEGGETKTV